MKPLKSFWVSGKVKEIRLVYLGLYWNIKHDKNLIGAL